MGQVGAASATVFASTRAMRPAACLCGSNRRSCAAQSLLRGHAQCLCGFKAVALRHHDVEHDHIRNPVPDTAQRFAAANGGASFNAFVRKIGGKRFGSFSVVVDHQHSRVCIQYANLASAPGLTEGWDLGQFLERLSIRVLKRAARPMPRRRLRAIQIGGRSPLQSCSIVVRKIFIGAGFRKQAFHVCTSSAQGGAAEWMTMGTWARSG
jgi:hypothetical protein